MTLETPRQVELPGTRPLTLKEKLQRTDANGCIDRLRPRTAPPINITMHYPGRIVFRCWKALLAALFLTLLAGCEPAKPETYGAGITGYNFTAEGVQGFYVNGQYGQNLPPYGGGGKSSCCITVPHEWRPGLVAKIDWTIGHYTVPWEKRKHLTPKEEGECCWTERTLSKTVSIEPYKPEGGGLQVFFLPNDEVKVWVTNYGLGHEKHPSGMRYPERAADSKQEK